MDVLIFYEHKVREYPACCAIKAELAKRGIRSSICHNTGPGIWKYRLFACPRVTIGPSALETKIGENWSCLDNYTSFLSGTAHFFVNLQVEQIFPNGDSDHYNIVKEPAWRKQIIYVCWGNRRKRQLIEKGIPKEQIVVTGAAHLDFIFPPLSSCYSGREDVAKTYRIDLHKKWNLFISSYTYADIPKKDLQWIIQTCGRTESSAVLDIYSMAEVSTKSRMITLDWIERYLSVYPEEIFIYRPHPGEYQNPRMKEMLQKFPNRFLIIASEPLQQWLLAADVIDLWLSTAIVDIWKMDKPCFLIQPMLPPAYFIPITIDCDMAIRSYEDFEKAHQAAETFSANRFPGKKEVLEDCYSFSSLPAYIKICDITEDLLEKNPPAEIPTKFGKKSVFAKWYLKQILTAFLAYWRIRPSRLFPFFRNILQPLEEDALNREDIFFRNSERKLYRRIRRTIQTGRSAVK